MHNEKKQYSDVRSNRLLALNSSPQEKKNQLKFTEAKSENDGNISASFPEWNMTVSLDKHSCGQLKANGDEEDQDKHYNELS